MTTAPRKERRRRERPARDRGAQLPNRLSPEQEAELQRELDALRDSPDEVQAHIDREYDKGERTIHFQDRGLWKLAARPRGEGSLHFIAGRTGVSRATLDTRTVMVRNFTREQALALAAEGLCLSLIAELARAEPELREDLKRIMREGATYEEIEEVRRTGNEVLRHKEPEPKLPPSRAERADRARAAMHKARAQTFEAAAEKKRMKNEARRRAVASDRDAPPPPLSSSLAEDTEKTYLEVMRKKSEVAQEQERAEALMAAARRAEEEAAARTQATQAALAEAEQHKAESQRVAAELERQQQALASGAGLAAAAAAAGQPLSEYLATQAEQARAAQQVQAQATQTLAEAQARLQQAAAQEATATAAAQEARAQIAAAAETQAQSEAAAARLSGLKAQAAEVEQGKAQIAAREAELAGRELALAEREQGFAVREEALGNLETEVAEQQAALAEREEEVNELSLRVAQIARREMLVKWDDLPQTLDEVMTYIDMICTHMTLLCEQGREYLERDMGMKHGGLMEVRTANRASKAARDQMAQLVEEIGDFYDEYRPDDVETYREQLQQEAATAAQTPGGGGTPQGGGSAPPSAGGNAPPAPANPAPRSSAAPYNTMGCIGGNVTLAWASADAPKVPIEVVLGSGGGIKKQAGLFALSKSGGGIFLDLNRPQVISIYGLQDSGKTSSMLAITEMLMGSHKRINVTPQPLGGIWCHFGKGRGYAPGIARAGGPNTERESVRLLTDKLGALPAGLQGHIEVLVPPMRPEQLAERRQDFPGRPVSVLSMTVGDLGLQNIRLFMQAGDNASIYMAMVDRVFRELPLDASLEEVEAALLAAPFTPQGRTLMEARWAALRPYLTATVSIRQRLKPGTLLILDIRGDWITEREAMTLFAILMDIFSQAVDENGQRFLKFIVFDEAQKYMGKASADIIAMIREMRHRLMTVIIGSQDPEALDIGIHKLSTITIVHKTRSVLSLKALRMANVAWDDVSIEALAAQAQGECYIASKEASVEAYSVKAQPAKARPTCAMPTGTTQTAVSED